MSSDHFPQQMGRFPSDCRGREGQHERWAGPWAEAETMRDASGDMGLGTGRGPGALGKAEAG